MSVQQVCQTLQERGMLYLIFLNINNFSHINSAYGYECGDEVIAQVEEHLHHLLDNESLLLHYNADKFAIFKDASKTQREIQELVVSILSYFSNVEIEVDEITMSLNLSIGISRAKGLINITQAEMAIAELRSTHENSYLFFDATSVYVYHQQQHIHWMQKLREAVEEERIVAYFQPIVNNATGKIEKYECLARIHEDEDIIAPYQFLKAAEDTGHLSYVTKTIITQSFTKFAKTSYEFSINITGYDLAADYLEAYLLHHCNKYNIYPQRVVLEILEDIQTLTTGKFQEQLEKLRMDGFQVAIDDFGASNSNFSRLLEIEPDYLKIDGAFIKNILEDEKSQIIVDAIVLLCKRSKIKMIAEFIHSKAVQEKIESLGIEYSQGFYHGAPNQELVE